jgi:serine/arginine repetitive matrix protein 2
MRSNKGPSPISFSPFFFTTPKPPPRRPSLASIFRIGNKKTKSAVLYTDVGVVDPATTGAGGEYSNSTGDGEEDWVQVRVDLASDLDAAAVKTLGIVNGTCDVSATVRSRGGVRTKADEKKVRVSPYLQNQSLYENNQHHPPLHLASSSSTSLGNFLARHSIIPKQSFSASQLSILSSAGGDGHQQHSPKAPSRISTVHF